eukprot:242393-Chlamydomonas_euryale.AAC.3
MHAPARSHQKHCKRSHTESTSINGKEATRPTRCHTSHQKFVNPGADTHRASKHRQREKWSKGKQSRAKASKVEQGQAKSSKGKQSRPEGSKGNGESQLSQAKASQDTRREAKAVGTVDQRQSKAKAMSKVNTSQSNTRTEKAKTIKDNDESQSNAIKRKQRKAKAVAQAFKQRRAKAGSACIECDPARHLERTRYLRRVELHHHVAGREWAK